jgi:hypothetical protein
VSKPGANVQYLDGLLPAVDVRRLARDAHGVPGGVPLHPLLRRAVRGDRVVLESLETVREHDLRVRLDADVSRVLRGQAVAFGQVSRRDLGPH